VANCSDSISNMKRFLQNLRSKIKFRIYDTQWSALYSNTSYGIYFTRRAAEKALDIYPNDSVRFRKDSNDIDELIKERRSIVEIDLINIFINTFFKPTKQCRIYGVTFLINSTNEIVFRNISFRPVDIADAEKMPIKNLILDSINSNYIFIEFNNSIKTPSEAMNSAYEIVDQLKKTNVIKHTAPHNL